MSGFFSLEGAPKWWFDRRIWIAMAVGLVLMMGTRWAYGPSRVAPGQVVFYSTSSCPYCKALRAHLEASNIPYVERNVEDSWRNRVSYMWAAGRSAVVPVVQVGPKVVAKGFFRSQIDAELRAAGYAPVAGASGPEGATAR